MFGAALRNDGKRACDLAASPEGAERCIHVWPRVRAPLTRTTVDHAVWASEMIIDPELGIGRQTLTRSASSWRTSSALAQGFRQQKREGYVPRPSYWAFNDSNDMGFTR